MVDGISDAGAGITGFGPSTTDAAGSSALGKDEFVKLLMTQMQNQDPTSPQDSEAFVAQLATFAQVELAQASMSRLEAILVGQAASNQLATTALVGKDVTLAGEGLSVRDGKASPTVINLDGDAESVIVTVKDKDGKEVAKVDLGNRPAGDLSFTWDGETMDGHAPDGEYSISVVASDATGESIDATIHRRGRVEGVSFEGGVPALIIGGMRFPLADVVGVHNPDGDTESVTGTSLGLSDGDEDAEEPPQGKLRPDNYKTTDQRAIDIWEQLNLESQLAVTVAKGKSVVDFD